jgi:dTDP-4-dehydrorhamnose reductase
MRKKILILGGTGMLGHVLLRYLFENSNSDVYATCRNVNELSGYFPSELVGRFLDENILAEHFDTVLGAMASVKPDTVINCIGITKQLPMASNPLPIITLNARFPHRLSLACNIANARMIHMSTDCVFDGKKGMYTEDDIPTPEDLYGRTKCLGEANYPHCLTFRKSLIGHELRGMRGLVEWFLGESGKVRGYKKAIYSGFSTIEFARIIRDYVLPDEHLNGIYHVSSEPISKFDLLHMIAKKYGKTIEIEPYEDLAVDRSLLSDRFRSRTGYIPPSWPEMIDAMHADYEANMRQYGSRSL